jgi:hypothetical protein
VSRRRSSTTPLILLALLLLAGGASSRAVRSSAKGMSLAALTALARSVGFPDPALAAAVAMAESGGVPDIRGDNGDSYGLWQVNLPAHPEYKANPSALLDAATNARAALAISAQGTNWQPWTTFRTGAYKPFYAPANA